MSERVRLLELCEDFPPRSGGGGVHAFELSKRLARRGHETRVIAAAYSPTEGAEFALEKVGSNRLTYFIGALGRIPSDRDIYHAHGWLPGLLFVARGCRPRIWTPHGWHLSALSATEPRIVVRRLKSVLGRFVASSHFDHYIIVDEESHRQLLARGVAEEAITKVPNGVDLARFSSVEPASGDEKVFLFAGRMEMEQKGIRTILAVAKRLKDERAISFLLVGSGEDEGTVDEVIRREGLTNVLRMSYTEDLAPLYARATALLITSPGEGFPLVLLEAMASGRPIIATRVGEIPSVAQEGRGGLFLDPGDAATLADHIRTLATDPAAASRMGAWNRERAKAYDWDIVAEQVERTYRRVLSAR